MVPAVPSSSDSDSKKTDSLVAHPCGTFPRAPNSIPGNLRVLQSGSLLGLTVLIRLFSGVSIHKGRKSLTWLPGGLQRAPSPSEPLCHFLLAPSHFPPTLHFLPYLLDGVSEAEKHC